MREEKGTIKTEWLKLSQNCLLYTLLLVLLLNTRKQILVKAPSAY